METRSVRSDGGRVPRPPGGPREEGVQAMETATGPTPPPAAPATPTVPLGYATAERVRIGFLPRFIAAILDGVVTGILIGIPSTILGFIPHVGWIGRVVGGLLALAYMSLEVFKARSLGKACLGLTITAQDGSAASRDRL